MNSLRLFLRPAVVLFALVLVAGVARTTADPKDNMQRAADKIHDMWVAADKGDFDAVTSAGDSATEYLDLAYTSLSDLAEKNSGGGYDRPQRETADAREWVKQTIKDAKAKEPNDCREHATKALASINHAIDDLPK